MKYGRNSIAVAKTVINTLPLKIATPITSEQKALAGRILKTTLLFAAGNAMIYIIGG